MTEKEKIFEDDRLSGKEEGTFFLVEAQDAGATWMEDVLTLCENPEEWLGLNYQEFMQAAANADRPAFPAFETTAETYAAYQGAWEQLEFSRRLHAEDNIYQEDLVKRKEEDAQ